MTIDNMLIVFSFGVLLGIIIRLMRQNRHMTEQMNEATQALGIFATLCGGRVEIYKKMAHDIPSHGVLFGETKDHKSWIVALGTDGNLGDGDYLCLGGNLIKGAALFQKALHQVIDEMAKEKRAKRETASK